MELKAPELRPQLEGTITTLQKQAANPVGGALTSLGIVHFARFVFVTDTHFAVITDYDGDLTRYVQEFANTVGVIFDQLLTFVKDAPPLPVNAHPDEFLSFVQKYDRPSVVPFYSAYPDLTVQDILTLRNRQSKP